MDIGGIKMEIIKGIIPAMGTPTKSEKEIDIIGLKNMTRYFIDSGVHGLFVLGSMGGCGFFGPNQVKDIVKPVAEENNGQLPVLVGISDTSTQLAIRRGIQAKKAGADAVVLAPPYYFNFTIEQIKLHYKLVANSVALPLFIYNNPGYTGFKFTPELVYELSKEKNIIGIKDSGGNFSETIAFINKFKDHQFGIYSGDEKSFGEAIAWGADGAVIGTNFDPKLLVSIYQAGKSQNTEQLKKLQNQLNSLMEIQFFGDLFAGYHYAFKLLNICDEYVMNPVRKLNKKQKEKIESILKEHSLI